MTNNIEKITKHYHREVNGEALQLHVKEWDMDVFYKKTYPFVVESKVLDLQAKGHIVEALIESLIQKALDKSGKKIFNEADRVVLMNEADPGVITKIAGTINNAALKPKIDDLVKEQKPTLRQGFYLCWVIDLKKVYQK